VRRAAVALTSGRASATEAAASRRKFCLFPTIPPVYRFVLNEFRFCPLHTDMQDNSETVAHPDAATIEAYCLGQITQAAINFIEAHIAGCPECGRKISDCVRQQMGVERP
jgi:hypothetical protein